MLKWILLILGIWGFCFDSFAKSRYPIYLSDYCSHTLAEQDCSEEFYQVIKKASEENKPVVIQQGQEFLIRSVETTGLDLKNIEILGIGNKDSLPTIITDRLYLFDIDNLTLANFRVRGLNVGIDSEDQGTSMVMTGGRHQSMYVDTLTIRDMVFEDSAEDLLAVWNARNIEVSGSEFRRAGLAMRIAPVLIPGDLRPRGSGIVLLNIEDLVVRGNKFYEIKKMGIFLGSETKENQGIAILNNYFDLKSESNPTSRYGLLGGAAVYVGNSHLFSDILIQGNEFLGFKMNGIRLNGKNITVKKNHFNSLDGCSGFDDGTAVGMGIKSHFLENADISDNCFFNVTSAVSLESWRNISNVRIEENKVFNTKNAFYSTDREGSKYERILFNKNQVYNAEGYAIALHSVNFSNYNRIVGNTIFNKEKSQAPMILLVKQNNFYFDNNWVKGLAGSMRWNYVRVNNVTNSVFKRSFFGSINGEDSNYGGIYIEDANSVGNYFNEIKFSRLNPGMHGSLEENSVGKIVYE